MVTTRFFRFFTEGGGRFGFLDIYKCPKSICGHQTQNCKFFYIYRKYIVLYYKMPKKMGFRSRKNKKVASRSRKNKRRGSRKMIKGGGGKQ